MATFNYRYLQARLSVPDPYYVLDLKKRCTPSEAQRAYIKLALLVHPDKAVDPTNATEIRQRNELAGLLNAAYDVYKKRLLAATPMPEVVTKKAKKPKFEKPTPEQHPLPEDVPWVSRGRARNWQCTWFFREPECTQWKGRKAADVPLGHVRQSHVSTAWRTV